MKRLRFIIAAALAICIVQGAWAIGPGGALGGGGKSAQAHPQQEGALVSQPVEPAAATADIQGMARTTDAPILDEMTSKPKVEIGKTASEGQSGTDVDDATFSKVASQHAQKKEIRHRLKEALQKHRDAIKQSAPESPADDQLILYVILAILLPPLAVALYLAGITTEFWICLLLTLLFYIPGLIYALWVILAK